MPAAIAQEELVTAVPKLRTKHSVSSSFATTLVDNEDASNGDASVVTGVDAAAAANARLSRLLSSMPFDGFPDMNTADTSVPPAQVNPASVPTRTSSTNAVARREKEKEKEREKAGKEARERPTSPKSPKRHPPLGSVPEEDRERRRMSEVMADERQWMAQGKSSKISSGGSPQRVTSSQRNTLAPLVSMDPLCTLGSDLINGNSSGWTTEKENILKGPFDYLESHPGKDVRTQLISAFNAWLQVPPTSLKTITRVVAMLHTASLLVDDVEDSSQLRRGIPVAHSIFGTAQTINSANYVYFTALQELLTLNNPEAIRIYTEELLNLHRGQGMDLFWRDTLTCPTEDDYLEMVGNKTGGLFRLAVKLMCAESPLHNFNPDPGSSSSSSAHQPTDCIPLVNTVGLLFQILDDYRNLSSPIYTENKGVCEDLTEGKFSFPIIHAIRSDPSSLVLINILKQKTQDEDVKKYAVGYMERAGSFAYTRRVLRGLTKKALALVDEVDAGQGRADGIRAILEHLRVEKSRERARESV